MVNQQEPKGFKRAKAKAEALLSNKDQLLRLFHKSQFKAKERANALKDIKDELSALLRLIQAYLNSEYKRVPTKSIIYAIAALVYLVNPLDLIPDFILFTGLLDDVTVISFVIQSIRQDIEEFLEWEKQSDKT